MASTQYSFERREEKYFLTPVQYEALLTPLRQHMHADEHEQYTICSLYCDTPHWQLIRTSLEKPYYKEKLRVRSYGTPTPDGRVFVELKKKVGGIVYKRRIALPAARADAFLRGEVSVPGQIAREISWFQRMYGAQPRLLIAYDRTAFAGVTEPGLRVTFDTGIRWRTDHLSLTAGDGGAPLLGLQNISIVCHGRSNSKAICSATRMATLFVEKETNQRLMEAICANEELTRYGRSC